MNDFVLPEIYDSCSVEMLFRYSVHGLAEGIFSYTDEDGLTAGISPTGNHVRLFFLLNASSDQTLELAHPWANYVFYLDEQVVARSEVPLHFQLIFSPTAEYPTFEIWAETVMRYLCACFLAPGIPGFDCHDVASVLQGATSSRLSFSLVRGIDDGQLMSNLSGHPRSPHLLAVLFATKDWLPSNQDLERLDKALLTVGGDWIKRGGACHPYEERVLMLLGD